MRGAAGMACAFLRANGYGNAFTAPPSARFCREPVVLTGLGWKAEARLADGRERGVERVRVLVCCEAADDAERTCLAVESDLRRAGWAAAAGSGWCRMVAVETEKPTYRGRDGSGRWLWGFEMDCMVVRSFV